MVSGTSSVGFDGVPSMTNLNSHRSGKHSELGHIMSEVPYSVESLHQRCADFTSGNEESAIDPYTQSSPFNGAAQSNRNEYFPYEGAQLESQEGWLSKQQHTANLDNKKRFIPKLPLH